MSEPIKTEMEFVTALATRRTVIYSSIAPDLFLEISMESLPKEIPNRIVVTVEMPA